MCQEVSEALQAEFSDRGPQARAAEAAEHCVTQWSQRAPARGSLGAKRRRAAKWRLHALNSKDLEIGPTAFQEVCKDVLASLGSPRRMSRGALFALHAAAEGALTVMFAQAGRCAAHAQRATLWPKDIRLLKTLQPQDALFCAWQPSGPDKPTPRARANEEEEEAQDEAS